MSVTNARQGHFRTDAYRIRFIEIDCGGVVTVYSDAEGVKRREPTRVKFGEPFRLRVGYECLLPVLPDTSCGVAAAFTRADDKEPVMYFNTNYPHSDEELINYENAEFRQPILRHGVIEGLIPHLQVRPDTYLLTVGILPNAPTHHEFYELHYLDYPIIVEGDRERLLGAFRPVVTFLHQVPETADDLPPHALRAGVAAIAKRLPGATTKEAEEVVRNVYLAVAAAMAASDRA